MTVWLVQESFYRDQKTGTLHPRFNMEALAKWGPIEICVTHTAKPWDVNVHQELRDKLDQFQPGDMLAAVGDPVLLSFAASYVADQHDGEFKMLKWHPGGNSFSVVELNIWGVDSTDQTQ